MSHGFEKLKEIGVAKIHKDTHISVSYIKSIISEDFEKINKVQLSGFISILEREYNVDLSAIKSEALENMPDQEYIVSPETENIFVDTDAKKISSTYYIILIIIVFIIAILYSIDFESEEKETYVEDTMIEEVKKNITETQKEKAVVVEPKEEVAKLQELIVDPSKKAIEIQKEEPVIQEEEPVIQEEEPVIQEEITIDEFKIFPKFRVWVGYIDVVNEKKKQKIISEPMAFNASKEWLFLFGHGNVNIEINENNNSYSGRTTLRLHYKNAKISKLTLDEFKKINNGRKW